MACIGGAADGGVARILERVELLKGPGVLLNGMPPFGSIGGVLNLVPKRRRRRAAERRDRDLRLGRAGRRHMSTSPAASATTSSSACASTASIATATRRSIARSQEVGAAVMGMDFRGERLRVSLDYGYQKQRYNAPLGFTYVAAGVPVPLAPGGHSNWFQPWTYMESPTSSASPRPSTTSRPTGRSPAPPAGAARGWRACAAASPPSSSATAT